MKRSECHVKRLGYHQSQCRLKSSRKNCFFHISWAVTFCKQIWYSGASSRVGVLCDNWIAVLKVKVTVRVQILCEYFSRQYLLNHVTFVNKYTNLEQVLFLCLSFQFRYHESLSGLPNHKIQTERLQWHLDELGLILFREVTSGFTLIKWWGQQTWWRPWLIGLWHAHPFSPLTYFVYEQRAPSFVLTRFLGVYKGKLGFEVAS